MFFIHGICILAPGANVSANMIFHPALGFNVSVLGFNDSLLRSNDLIFGFNDSLLGFNHSILGFMIHSWDSMIQS